MPLNKFTVALIGVVSSLLLGFMIFAMLYGLGGLILGFTATLTLKEFAGFVGVYEAVSIFCDYQKRFLR